MSMPASCHAVADPRRRSLPACRRTSASDQLARRRSRRRSSRSSSERRRGSSSAAPARAGSSSMRSRSRSSVQIERAHRLVAIGASQAPMTLRRVVVDLLDLESPGPARSTARGRTASDTNGSSEYDVSSFCATWSQTSSKPPRDSPSGDRRGRRARAPAAARADRRPAPASGRPGRRGRSAHPGRDGVARDEPRDGAVGHPADDGVDDLRAGSPRAAALLRQTSEASCRAESRPSGRHVAHASSSTPDRRRPLLTVGEESMQEPHQRRRLRADAAPGRGARRRRRR